MCMPLSERGHIRSAELGEFRRIGAKQFGEELVDEPHPIISGLQ